MEEFYAMLRQGCARGRKNIRNGRVMVMKNLAFSLALGVALSAAACSGAWAQGLYPQPNQSTAAAPNATALEGMKAVENLDRWRETLIPMFMNDYGDLARYRSADAALGNPRPDEQRVVFFGDSITDIWKLDKYFPGKGYINRGISGQTTEQMLVRFRQDVVDLHPAVVVILAGTNDIAGNTGPETLAQIEGDFATMEEVARANGIRVVLSSLTPENGTKPQWTTYTLLRPPHEIVELNDWLQRYCRQNGLVYLDYYSAMVDAQGRMKPALTRDGLHPSAAGFEVMAPLAERAIRDALGKPVVMGP
jgi:lysophospholipase L1-like esterase